MSYLEKTPTLKKVGLQLAQDMRETVNILREMKLYNQLSGEPAKTDARDFVPMVAMLGIQGATREERNQHIRNTLTELAQAFSDPDRSARNKYLDMVYNLRDTMKPDEVDMNDPEQVNRLLQYVLLDQTYGTKKKENLEYYNSRYSTTAEQIFVDSVERITKLVDSRVITNCNQLGFRFNIDLTLPPPVSKDTEPYQKCREQLASTLLNDEYAIKQGRQPSNVVNLPLVDEVLQYMEQDPRVMDDAVYNKRWNLYQFYTLCIEETTLTPGSKKTQAISEATLTAFDAIYIDGTPAEEFCKNLFPNEGIGGATQKNAAALVVALVSGNHNVDVVHGYKDDNGQMQYEAKALKPIITEEQYMRQFNWIHRTLFNWGPFRIEPYQEKMARVMRPDPNMEERHEKICENMKTRVTETIKKREEEKIIKAREDQFYKDRKIKLNKETERLRNSVKQWDKDSVLGILGDQIKDSYNFIKLYLNVSVEERYKTISIPLAKQVIYSQLCLAREESPTKEPCKAELDLLGDGTKETIEKNIEATANEMVKDPTFIKLVNDKLGVLGRDQKTIELQASKFNDLMIAGGCLRLAQEYNIRLKEKAEQIADQAKPLENIKEANQQQEDKQLEQAQLQQPHL